MNFILNIFKIRQFLRRSKWISWEHFSLSLSHILWHDLTLCMILSLTLYIQRGPYWSCRTAKAVPPSWRRDSPLLLFLFLLHQRLKIQVTVITNQILKRWCRSLGVKCIRQHYYIIFVWIKYTCYYKIIVIEPLVAFKYSRNVIFCC